MSPVGRGERLTLTGTPPSSRPASTDAVSTPSSLQKLRRARKRRDEAELAYRAAVIVAALDVGYAEAARAAGLSRQAVRQLVLRAKRH